MIFQWPISSLMRCRWMTSEVLRLKLIYMTQKFKTLIFSKIIQINWLILFKKEKNALKRSKYSYINRNHRLTMWGGGVATPCGYSIFSGATGKKWALSNCRGSIDTHFDIIICLRSLGGSEVTGCVTLLPGGGGGCHPLSFLVNLFGNTW